MNRLQKELARGVLCAMALVALASVATPAAAVAAEETARVMPTPEADALGYTALVNTLGLRATTLDLAGQYVTIAKDFTTGRMYRRLEARTANQLFTEFGVFRHSQGRFKLLGADGRWVSIRRNAKSRRDEVGTWAARWGTAWSFKLKRPVAFGPGVVHDMADMGIDSREALCVLAYSPLGALRGSLAVSEAGVMTLRRATACGDSTSALFITDSVTKEKAPGDLVKGVHIDPITYVRFVPPDLPALTLSLDNRRLMRNEVIDYFTMLASYNDFLLNDVRSAVHTTATVLLTTSYVIPGDKAKEINLASFFVDQASYALACIPAYGAVASGVLKATYDRVELGLALAHNANLRGPRVVESITNTILRTEAEITREYEVAYSHFGRNLDRMRNSILEGCTEPDTCVSDRALAAWFHADPLKDITTEVTRLTRDTEVARHELTIWRKLLPLRGVLFAPGDMTLMPARAGSANCNPGYPLNSPYRNEEIVARYASWTGHPELQPVPAVVSGVYYPYYNWYEPFWCAGTDVHRAYMEGWTFALTNDRADPTRLSQADELRLFAPWNPLEPLGSGLGLSRTEVACEWLRNRVDGYWGSAGYYFNPCHFAFYDVNGVIVSPYQGEDSRYGAAAPYATAYWTPDTVEVAAGRQVTDPDVLSPLVPDMEFGSCAALQSGATKTVVGGAAVKVYFTNLHDGAVDVLRIRTDGSTVLLFTLARQDHLARPLPNTSKGPLRLTYSRLVNTTVGTSFLVRRHSDAACIGTWTARQLPVGAPVDYAVAEVHGSNGILFTRP